MPMKPQGNYPKVESMTEAKIMDVYNGYYEPMEPGDTEEYKNGKSS